MHMKLTCLCKNEGMYILHIRYLIDLAVASCIVWRGNKATISVQDSQPEYVPTVCFIIL